MAAEGAVNFLLEKIEYIVAKEWGLPEKINDGIKNLRTELKTIQALLKDADVNTKGEHEHHVTDWLAQVRDLAYDIEDVLDTWAFHEAQPHASHWYSYSRFKANHSIDDLIDRINSKLKKISETREWYCNIVSSSASSSIRRNYTNLHQRIAPLFMEDADVVGIEETKAKLTSWALQERDTYKAMFVVGMGGSGKTTLIKRVYERVKGDFMCHAWITASRSKTKLELLRTMFGQIGCQSLSQDLFINQVDLMQTMRDHLQDKRYLIILDDLWVKDVWESINYALPKRVNRGGRIIITTRRGDIAYSCRDNSVNVHEIQPLPLEMAQQLFYKKAFPQDGRCPSHLVGCSQNILKKCEGLPLGIIEIGHFLSHRESSESEWQKSHDSLESELKRSGRLSNTMTVLSISYNDLPYHLKYCFLYLSIFPEDYPVKRRRLIRLWIAEGFIREATGKELEDVGEEYLKELIERSLVQASELDFDGSPRRCRVHNLMHKIILSKSQEEKFCTLCTELARGSNLYEKTRRISIQKNTTGFKLAQQNLTSCRTLFMFGKEGPDMINSSSYKLLRVLHLEGASFDKFPNEIVELLLLRYLCLSNTRISSIPKSIGKLRHLETLDLKQTLVTKLPKQVTNLDNLRHLLVYHYNMGSYVSFDTVKGFSISSKVGALKNLQKLSFVKANRHHGMIRALENLTQLKKLGIIDLPRENGLSLCSTIQKLRKLQSLNVTSSHQKECIDLENISYPPLLRRLYLKGRLERLPFWISKLHDLVRIRLKWSRLGDNNNPIELLQDLPNLLELQLFDAYTGTHLEFSYGKFQKLKILEFELLEELGVVIMCRGTLPCLQKLIIRRCYSLVQLPVGIERLTGLKELHLCDMPVNFVTKLKYGGELRHLVSHIPLILAHFLPLNGQMVWENLS